MEHKIVTGGEQFLPFARSRIKALRATGLEYASQSFEMGDASVKVRIMPGHEYITLSGDNSYISVFPNIQYPESGFTKTKFPGAPGINFLSGTFPATYDDPATLLLRTERKTSFGISASAKHIIRKERAFTISDTGASIPVPLVFVQRTGVIINGVQFYRVFVDGVAQEQISLKSPYLGVETYEKPPNEVGFRDGSGYTHYKWATRTSEVAYCINNGDLPALATLEIETTDNKFYEAEFIVVYGGVPFALQKSGTRAAGASWIRLRVLRKNNDSPMPQYKSFDVGRLPYSWEKGITKKPGTFINSGYFDEVDEYHEIVNDIECTLNYRRGHAMDRTSVARNGSVFVLRETSNLSVHNVALEAFVVIHQSFTVMIDFGWQLSFVSPDDLVQEAVVTGQLGAYGYIDGIIPSADGSKVYVYYGLNNTGEVITPNTKNNLGLQPALEFTEYLDEITVNKTDEFYSFQKKRTIGLGSVTLRSFGSFPNPPKTDHFASKLHGATLAVKGFIWADRYCYSVKDALFIELSNFVERIDTNYDSSPNRARDQITGADSDNSSYIRVASDGKSATYFQIRFGLATKYKLIKNEETGMREAQLVASWSIPSVYADTDDLSAVVAQFS